MAPLDPTAVRPPHAPLLPRDDWHSSSVDELCAPTEPGPENLGNLLPTLARSWSRAGLDAHAAVAAYARLSLRLMSLGAPPQLIQGCAQAMQEEIAHAQACFSLARRYGGRHVGPGPLPPPELSGAEDLTSVVLGVVRQGCIGEAVSALSAREALEHCQDPATREVLIRQHAAKAQQAQLAWRLVAWALRGAGAERELPDHVRVAVVTALSGSEATAPLDEGDRLLLRHGVLGEQQRVALAQRILREVVLPCMDALLSRSSTAKHGRG